jgi:hypothetical protein
MGEIDLADLIEGTPGMNVAIVRRFAGRKDDHRSKDNRYKMRLHIPCVEIFDPPVRSVTVLLP